MKTWIKCVVLVLSSIISFVMLYAALYIGIEAITGGLNYPATASLPILGMLTAIVALILFSVWCFAYTKENKRKGLGITAVIFGAVAVLSLFISPIVNSVIGNDGNATINQSSAREYAAYEEYNWCLDLGKFMDVELVAAHSDTTGSSWKYKMESVPEHKLQQYIDYHVGQGFTYTKTDGGLYMLFKEGKSITMHYFAEQKHFMIVVSEK